MQSRELPARLKLRSVVKLPLCVKAAPVYKTTVELPLASVAGPARRGAGHRHAGRQRAGLDDGRAAEEVLAVPLSMK